MNYFLYLMPLINSLERITKGGVLRFGGGVLRPESGVLRSKGSVLNALPSVLNILPSVLNVVHPAHSYISSQLIFGINL